MTQDKVLLHGLVFHGYHGYIPAEQELGQKFEVDLELTVGLTKPGRSDDLKETVDYTKVYAETQRIVEGKKFKLLEALAEDIAQTLVALFPVEEVFVRVKKPHVSIKGPVDYLGVEVRRSR